MFNKKIKNSHFYKYIDRLYIHMCKAKIHLVSYEAALELRKLIEDDE